MSPPLPTGPRFRQALAPLAAIVAGAVLLVWPAFLNGYPLVFSDTHAFLVQAGEPQMVWDKPFFYGPFLRAFHLNITLWLPLAAQGLIVSHLLWFTRAAFAPPRALFHLGLCALLALGSAAPWFTALLMPDIFAPVAVLCLFLLGFAPALPRARTAWLAALAAFAIATHLSYLPLAAAVIAVALVLRGRRIVLAPLAAALAMLVVTNAIGHGKPGISPYGSVFALARLVTDGPAQAILARDCPQSGWRLCAWQGRFPPDSDKFLWDGQGPVWSTPGGPKALAPEAAEIVRRTVTGEPLWVLRGALANAARQLVIVQLGDTLGPDWLETSITGSLRAYFPPAEMARLKAGLQWSDRLRPLAAPFNAPHAALLLLGAAATLALLVAAWRRGDRPAAAFAAIALTALLANAAASGALSKPNPRYQARIAWLVLLPPLLALPNRGAGRQRAAVTPPAASPHPPATSAPASRSRPAASP